MLFCLTCFVRAEEVQFEEAPKSPRAIPSSVTGTQLLRTFFDFIQWKPTDTWPRDRCGRAQLVLLPSLADFLHLGADL